MSRGMGRRFVIPGVALLAIVALGTVGYWFIGDRQYSVIDALYMTVIVITTIGFAEIVDLSGNPGGRLFTIFIAIGGMGILVYFVTNFTAFLVEGEITESFRRRKMEKLARDSKHHYIVCGVEGVALHIVSELNATKRPHIVVDTNKENLNKVSEVFPNAICIEGDATDNNTLLKVDILNARGLFAVTGDDNHNLVVCLTAKQLNPNIRVVARCDEAKSEEKMKKAGADAVVSPSLIGGLRMASEMLRPSVVSFLDIMLRQKENLRVEEIALPGIFVGKTISSLNLSQHRQVLLLAIKEKDGWVYNPSGDYVFTPGSALIFMATPEERLGLEKILRAE